VCCQQLYTTARELCLIERLDSDGIDEVDHAAAIFNTLDTKPPLEVFDSLKVYETFLHDVRRDCGASLELLCAASLGRETMIGLKLKDRKSLLAYIKAAQRSLDVPVLETLISKCNISALDSTYGRCLLDL